MITHALQLGTSCIFARLIYLRFVCESVLARPSCGVPLPVFLGWERDAVRARGIFNLIFFSYSAALIKIYKYRVTQLDSGCWHMEKMLISEPLKGVTVG